MTAEQAIGVFDSGVGGLSVLRAIRAELPHETLYYVADSAHAPYGDRSTSFVTLRASRLVDFFLSRKVKAVVVACNTVTGVAIEYLRQRDQLPMIAMEPAIKPAAISTRSGVIGVLATNITVASTSLSRLIAAYGQDVQVLLQACPGLVERVEAGDLESEQTLALVRQYVEPLLAQGADTLVLGCTHYPFLLPALRRIAGADIDIIDPAPAVARELRRRLTQQTLLNRPHQPGTASFWTSGEPQHNAPVISQLWGEQVRVQRLPPEYCRA